jgi:hypothetical protein
MTIYGNPVIDFGAIVKNQRYKAVKSWQHDGEIKKGKYDNRNGN